VEVDGEDISDTGEFRPGFGWGDVTVKVSKPGYKPRTVVVPRDRFNPALKWSALGVGTACTALSGCGGCAVGALLGNRIMVPGVFGAMLGALVEGGSLCCLMFPITLSNYLLIYSLVPDTCTVPCMGLGALVASWPVAFFALPLLAPVTRSEVEVILERSGESPHPLPTPDPVPEPLEPDAAEPAATHPVTAPAEDPPAPAFKPKKPRRNTP
jgi:hypothetical protein